MNRSRLKDADLSRKPHCSTLISGHCFIDTVASGGAAGPMRWNDSPQRAASNAARRIDRVWQHHKAQPDHLTSAHCWGLATRVCEIPNQRHEILACIVYPPRYICTMSYVEMLSDESSKRQPDGPRAFTSGSQHMAQTARTQPKCSCSTTAASSMHACTPMRRKWHSSSLPNRVPL